MYVQDQATAEGATYGMRPLHVARLKPPGPQGFRRRHHLDHDTSRVIHFDRSEGGLLHSWSTRSQSTMK